jgi:hypothetical protein
MMKEEKMRCRWKVAQLHSGLHLPQFPTFGSRITASLLQGGRYGL